MTGDNPDTLDDAAMRQLQAGVDSALDNLMQRHAPVLFHYLIRFLGSESDAEDITQETFVRVYTKRFQFNPKNSFKSWLYTIASNLARDHLRTKLRKPETSLDSAGSESAPLQIPDPAPTPGENIDPEQRASLVRNAIAKLPEELQLPLLLAEYEGFKQAEIAQILQCSRKAVEMRIYHARHQLKELLQSAQAYAINSQSLRDSNARKC